MLAGRWVLAVAGTHGKTTTSSLLTSILEHAGLEPGFLVGGVPLDFDVSARLGSGRHFVVEADEYDTAFFDKRAKFVHYRPRTAILNNLEHDHADIYPDVASIQRQFHLLLRTVPGNGTHRGERRGPESRARCSAWAAGRRCERFASRRRGDCRLAPRGRSGRGVCAILGASRRALRRATSSGACSAGTTRRTALPRSSAAHHAGVDDAVAIEALCRFRGVRRRLEVRGTVDGVVVYDDFAHHPTAIASTLEGVRHKAGAGRVIAVLEPRSNTMKLGTHKAALADSLRGADRVFVYKSPDVKWDVGGRDGAARQSRCRARGPRPADGGDRRGVAARAITWC